MGGVCKKDKMTLRRWITRMRTEWEVVRVNKVLQL